MRVQKVKTNSNNNNNLNKKKICLIYIPEIEGDEDFTSGPEDSNDSWATTEEFSTDFILRYGNRYIREKLIVCPYFFISIQYNLSLIFTNSLRSKRWKTYSFKVKISNLDSLKLVKKFSLQLLF